MESDDLRSGPGHPDDLRSGRARPDDLRSGRARPERFAASEWRERARRLKDEGWLLSDLSGVDALGLSGTERRFEIAVQLLQMDLKDRAMVHVEAIGEPPTVPSVTDLWPTANFMEREAYDMFGIVFEGHPNLTRILMPDEWEGYPLRKDYGVGKVQVEFRPEPLMQIERPTKWARHGAESTGPDGSVAERSADE